MGKRVAILQSNYIPWKGYFDLIRSVDEFILFDDVQYTKHDWRNRNRIKTPQGVQWLTIPVEARGALGRRIREVRVSDPGWAARHLKTLRQNYQKAPYFPAYEAWLQRLYLECGEDHLSRINRRFLEAVCHALGIGTRLSWSMDYRVEDGKTERLVSLCQQTGADEYLSGPSARDYLDESLFADAGIRVLWMDYAGYPEYPQMYPPFDHAVTILDLLLHTGPEAPRYLKAPVSRDG